MLKSLPKDYEWIIGRDFDISERTQGKSKDRGKIISSLQRYSCNDLLDTFQVQDKFAQLRGPRFSWTNDQHRQIRRLGKLNNMYTQQKNMIRIYHKTNFIHGYPVGTNHSPVQIEFFLNNGKNKKFMVK